MFTGRVELPKPLPQLPPRISAFLTQLSFSIHSILDNLQKEAEAHYQTLKTRMDLFPSYGRLLPKINDPEVKFEAVKADISELRKLGVTIPENVENWGEHERALLANIVIAKESGIREEEEKLYKIFQRHAMFQEIESNLFRPR